MSFIYFAHAAFSRQTVANQGQDEPIRTSSCPHVHCMSYGQWPNGTHGPKTPRTCRSAEPRTHTGGASRRAAGHRAGAGNRERYGRACRARSEEHTSELQSLMRSSYAVFCLKKKTTKNIERQETTPLLKH